MSWIYGVVVDGQVFFPADVLHKFVNEQTTRTVVGDEVLDLVSWVPLWNLVACARRERKPQLGGWQ